MAGRAVSLNSFQFQYGTIKRDLLQEKAELTTEFQFQYGTIKRRIG